MERKCSRYFIHAAGGLLLSDALVQFINVAGDGQIMTLPDPLLGVRHCYLALCMGAIEAAAALFCVFGKQITRQSGLLAWLITNWVVYRLGLVFEGLPWQYTWLGGLSDTVPFVSAVMNFFGIIIPLFLLVGACVIVLRSLRSKCPEADHLKPVHVWGNKKANWIPYFISATGVLLLADGLIRLLGCCASPAVMALPDPLLGVSLLCSTLGVGVVESAVALFCLFGKRAEIQCQWLLAAGVGWAVYSLGILRMGFSMKNTCMGSFLDPLQLSSPISGFIMEFAPICIILGAAAILFQHAKYIMHEAPGGGVCHASADIFAAPLHSPKELQGQGSCEGKGDNPRDSGNQCLGFSRVDMIFVIAGAGVILCLGGLKLKAMGEQSRTTGCARNLAVLGRAMGSYAAAHGQCFPLPRAGESEVTWDTQIAGDIPVNSISFSAAPGEQARLRHRAIQPSLQLQQASRIFVCPSDGVQRGEPRSYSMLRHDMRAVCPSVENREVVNLSYIGSPANTLLISEIICSGNDLGGSGWANFGGLGEQLQSFQGDRATFHGGRFNYLMMDGHVELLSPSETQNAGVYDSDFRCGIWILKAGK